jgi:clan AA aspartic protease (TIGR02281 family)
MSFIFLSIFLFSALIAGCTPGIEGPTQSLPATDKVSVPFQYPQMTVRATLNERVSTNFRVDTAASITVIPRASANALGIDLEKRLPAIPIQTVSGTIYVPVVVLDSREVGGMRVKDFTVVVYDLPYPDRPGLLGFDFLNHFRVQIDMKEGVLVLERK